MLYCPFALVKSLLQPIYLRKEASRGCRTTEMWPMASTHMQFPGSQGMCESYTSMPNTHETRKCVKNVRQLVPSSESRRFSSTGEEGRASSKRRELIRVEFG